MFEEQPGTRADMIAGALYAVAGDAGWIYYGQVTRAKKIGFFRRRDPKLLLASDVLPAPIMAVITVSYPSITRAMRSGRWKKLGRFPLVPDLVAPRPMVLWSVGTLTVTVCVEGQPNYDTRVEDPEIQDLERAAVWDAIEHIPARLTADFGEEKARWHVGGPIWRERRVKEEMAVRFADQPWHELPPDWIPASDRA